MAIKTEVSTYIAQSKGECRGGLIVIHEIWGLTSHIKSVADRFSQEGYLVLAPDLVTETDIEKVSTSELQRDLFSPDEAVRSTAQPKLRQLLTPTQSPDFAPKTVNRLKQCFEELYDNPLTQKKVGVIGFCFGGTYSFSIAIEEPRLKAAIPFYGHGAEHSVEKLRKINCPVLAFYGEKDERLMASLPELEEKMHEAGVDFTAQVYTDCGHAFFNDTNPHTYNPKAAADAWSKTLEFLATNLAK